MPTNNPTCPVCLRADTRLFHTQLGVPTQDGFIYPTRQQAIDAPRGDIRLHFCPACTHIFNDRFDPSLLRFDDGYDISLHHSPTYRAFIDDLIAGLVQRHQLRNKTVLEIGCGKADFLKAITIPFHNRGIGFDPTFIDANLTDDQRQAITVQKRFYGPADQSIQADFVTFRSMLQYHAAPRDFVSDCHGSVARPGGVVYAEVPHSAHTFERLCIWNIVYEHGCFYSRWSLAKLFVDCGYHVQNCFACFVEDQNLGIEAGIEPSSRRFTIDPRAVAAWDKTIDRFIAEHERLTHHWRSTLESLLRAGKRVTLWGAGARAISFCNLFGITETQIPHVVDINPKRQGRYLPLTLQQVVSPEQLLHTPPDVIIITNSGYEPEIRAQIASMNIGAEVMVL
jgi:SAM-dependent methyltransferase